MKISRFSGSFFLVVGLLTTAGWSQTALNFSRPGPMIHIPTASLYSYPYLLRLGVAGQSTRGIADGAYWNKGVFVETDITREFRIGLTAIQGPSAGDQAQIALHVQDRLLTYGETALGIGVHDITMNFGSDSTQNLTETVRNLSYYMLLSRENSFSNYSLKTFLGVGTGRYSLNFGKLEIDPAQTDIYMDTTPDGIWSGDTLTEPITSDFNGNGLVDTVKIPKANTIGFFIGMLLNTGVMADRGGLDVLMEYDGAGLNAGVRIPLTPEYKIGVALSNLQNLPYLGQDRENPPGIGFSLDYLLPRVKSGDKRSKGLRIQGIVTEEGLPVRTVIDSSWHKAQEQQLLLLRDSLRMTSAEIEHLNHMVEQLEQKNKVLEDSVAAMQLARHVSDARVNQALKHLSRSLRLFYNEEYEEALVEINEALEFNPNLALAYARRGSIYYKLSQIDRATINWNIALQIDPEYDEVRNILRALNENRLRSAVTAKE